MKTIYIIRHFKVKDSTNKRLNSNEFAHWIEEYDNFDLEYLNLNLPKFDKIYVSSQNRAIKTANYLKILKKQNLPLLTQMFKRNI